MMPLVSDSLGAVSFRCGHCAAESGCSCWQPSSAVARGARGGFAGGGSGAWLGGQGRVATLLFFGSVKQRKFLDARVVKGKSGQAFERGSRRLQWGDLFESFC